MQKVEVELVVGERSADEVDALLDAIGEEYFLDDRSDRGWGWVISSDLERSPNTDHAIQAFFAGLKPALQRGLIPPASLVLVACYHDTMNCTVQLSDLAALAEFKLCIEICCYPVDSW